MKSKTKFTFALTAIFISIAFMNCTPAVDSNKFIPATGNQATGYSAACFAPSLYNPVLRSGSLFAGAGWNAPSLLKINNQWVMYASSDVSSNNDFAIYRTTSNDALTWTLSQSSPVFRADTNPSAWDHRAVGTPSVVLFNGKYHMFYTGYATTNTDVANFKIGHAISDDGFNWTRDATYIMAPTNPTGVPNMDFNQYAVGEPGAVVFNNKIYLYFAAVGSNASLGTSLEVIGLMTSADGTTWSTAQQVLAPDQTLYPRSAWTGYSAPQPIVIDSQVHLFFSVVSASQSAQARLHHAVSADGIAKWTQDSQPIFRNISFTWTSNEIRSPAPIVDGTTLRLFFAGDNGSNLGIGFADCHL